MRNDNDSYHFHWWHWLIIIAVIFIVLGVAFTWISNMKYNNNQSYINGVEQTIEYPVDKTENAVKDITNK